jgi:hypothetical protein
MAIPLPERKKQIGGKILATSNPQSLIIYTPSSATVLGTAVNYNGEMATIRVCSSLDSLGPEVYAPVILPTDTNATKEQKNQFFRGQPKKGLMLYLENPANERFEVGVIDLYNTRPRFLTGINEFFSDLKNYGIEFGWKIVVEVIDRGWGVLQVNTGENQINDQVSITGFVIEQGSFLQDHNDVIYNYVG